MHRFHKTLTELKEIRKINDKAKIISDKNAWDEKNPINVARPYVVSEFLIDNPKHTSVSQIKAELSQEARKKAGLNLVPDFSVDEKPHPTLNFVENPSATCKKQLDKLRKKANLKEMKKLEEKTGTIEIGIDRLTNREECVYRQGIKTNRKTKDLIDEIRRKEMLENNMKVFGNVTIGIHGRELPKFQQF